MLYLMLLLGCTDRDPISASPGTTDTSSTTTSAGTPPGSPSGSPGGNPETFPTGFVRFVNLIGDAGSVDIAIRSSSGPYGTTLPPLVASQPFTYATQLESPSGDVDGYVEHALCCSGGDSVQWAVTEQQQLGLTSPAFVGNGQYATLVLTGFRSEPASLEFPVDGVLIDDVAARAPGDSEHHVTVVSALAGRDPVDVAMCPWADADADGVPDPCIAPTSEHLGLAFAEATSVLGADPGTTTITATDASGLLGTWSLDTPADDWSYVYLVPTDPTSPGATPPRALAHSVGEQPIDLPSY